MVGHVGEGSGMYRKSGTENVGKKLTLLQAMGLPFWMNIDCESWRMGKKTPGDEKRELAKTKVEIH